MKFNIVTDLSNNFNPYPKPPKTKKKEVKLIKQVGKKRTSVKDKTYIAVFMRDKGRCRLCGAFNGLELHHIDGRGNELTNDIDNCIMLCHYCHHDVVHKNQKEYRPKLKKILKKGE